MNSFIDDYLAWVGQLLGDPAGDVRTSQDQRLRDLHAHYMTLYERFLRTSEEIGYSESAFEIETSKDTYFLPGNFRRFIRLEKRKGGDPNAIEASIRAIPQWKQRSDQGAIIQPHAGRMLLVPRPTSDEGTYTLCYQSQPVLLHRGTVTGEQTGAMICTVDVGNFSGRANYYKGEFLTVIGATQLDGTSYEVQASVISGTTGLFIWAWDASGDRLILDIGTQYEFRPIVPRGLDKIIALSVALGRTSDRLDPQRRGMLKSEWNEMFAGCMHWLRSQATDMKRLPKSSAWNDVTIDPFAGP